jgi:hypothetical protein
VRHRRLPPPRLHGLLPKKLELGAASLVPKSCCQRRSSRIYRYTAEVLLSSRVGHKLVNGKFRMDPKPKKRRGRPPKMKHGNSSNPPVAKKAKHRHNISQAQRLRKLQEAREETREQFHKIKAKVLSMTPQHLKDMFGQVCFARFGKAWWLVLVLVPYNVPPGSVRNQWTEQFERVRNIVYLFGELTVN